MGLLPKRGAKAISQPTRRNSSGPSILVLNKVRAILELFAEEVEEAGPSAVAARVGGNKSTTSRLLSSMNQMGLLDKTSDGEYRLGLRLMELGGIVANRIDIRQSASPMLRDLRRECGMTVFLTVRHEYSATCIDRLAAAHVDILALRLGGVLPLYCGAGPRLLLASMSGVEREAYLGRAPFPVLTPKTLTTAKELSADVTKTRSLGYTLSVEDITPGVAAMAAPVSDNGGLVVAAISVAGLLSDFAPNADARARQVVEAAGRISEAIGGRASVDWLP